MLHKWLEDWHDTFLYVFAVFGLLGFFLSYWTGEYQNRYAELLLQEFLSNVAVTGKITVEEYENILFNISEISPVYEVGIGCTEYEQKPVHALFSKETLSEYYLSRNVKREKEFYKYEPDVIEENPELLCLQKESNGQILASVHSQLPLPRESLALEIEAVKPIQRVYCGEDLITICHVVSAEGEYYAEAQPIQASSSGIVYLKLELGCEEYQVPIQVYCYPRIVYCENGHTIVNSEERLTDESNICSKQCPYCAVLPLYISCNKELLLKETGTVLTENDISISVVYMNGTVAEIFPDSLEWQDSYDENFCGMQEVSVKYRGKEDYFHVITSNTSCHNCGGQCNERCYEDYVKLPYCLDCLAERELFSGWMYEEIICSSEELLAYLDVNVEKCFSRGALVRMYLKKKNGYVVLLQEIVKQDGKRKDN